MTKTTTWAVLFAVLLMTAASVMSAAPPVDPHDTSALQGSWSMVRADGYIGASKQTIQSLGGIIIKFGTHTFEDPAGNSPLYDKGTYTVDSSASPKAVDFHITKGVNKGGDRLAIYEIKGDTLRLCTTPIQGKRPPKFMTEEGYTVKIFRRQKQ